MSFKTITIAAALLATTLGVARADDHDSAARDRAVAPTASQVVEGRQAAPLATTGAAEAYVIAHNVDDR